jgi:hypothetical protein
VCTFASRHRPALKGIATVVTAAFLLLTLQPLAIAANQTPAATTTPRVQTNDEKLAKHIESIEKKLDQFEGKLNKKEDATKEKGELKTLRQDLDALDTQAIKDFDAIEAHLKVKNLPTVIQNRHLEAVTQYKTEMAALKANLDAIETEADDSGRAAKAQKAREHLKAKQKKRGPKTKFDPNDMPHKRLEADPKNKPKLKKDDFTTAGLFDNPYVKLAAHGTFTFDKLAGASDPAYLAATTEVVLTPAIQAKAEELQHNPVQIYNWVRNNVEWIPTWGAAQDADLTLGSKRGNAFDIASLTLALLRASGIPSRYVHGTIEVPEDKFRNWAGGFNSITAAADYAASGGIPITGVVTGGKITKVQMEHVWVEAAIDFYPSRGAINKSADSWIALDPSYKQYEFLQGLDVVAISGLDPTALATSFANSGTTNTAEGWVQNLNSSILTDAKAQIRSTLQAHIQNNMANATIGDLVGGKKIIQKTGSILKASLPNRSLVTGARYGTLPPSLQNKYELGFGIDILGDVNIVASFALAKVNNHKLTFSFKPSTAVDEQTLASLLPEGEITDPSQLPSSIPSYLIYVTPEIALEGQVVAQGVPMRLGEDLELVFQVTHANRSPMVKTYKVPAGSYLSLSANQGSVSPVVLQALQTKLTATKAKLESNDSVLIGTLTREDILGDMFQVGTLGYWGQYIAMANVASLSQNTKHNLASGFGSLGYEPNVDYFFGFPRAITHGGVAVNVWVADVNADTDGDSIRRRNFQFHTGVLSSGLEHSVPEQIMNSPTQPPLGVSAVKALQMAASQGQRIYHITSQNQALALPNLHLDGLAMSEISSALASGKEVIAHTDRISIPGFQGEGYILFDPATGAGAYKITGGGNGAFVLGLLTGPAMFISVMAAVIAFFAGMWLLFLVAIIAAVAWFLVWAQMSTSPVAGCFYAGMLIGNLLFEFVIAAQELVHMFLFTNEMYHLNHDWGEITNCGTS